MTGRFFEKYNGERQNTGLFNVCDRPYREALAEMAATHRRIYDVWLNGEPPYVFDHPRFTGGPGDTVRTVRAGHAVGPMAVDGQLAGWPGCPPERIAPDRLTVGRDSQGVEASFKVCWDEDALYLLAEVSDPTPMQNQHSGADLWSADGLELFIGSEALDQGGPLRFTDRQILIGAGNRNGEGQFHVVNAPRQPKVQMAVIPIAAARRPCPGNRHSVEHHWRDTEGRTRTAFRPGRGRQRRRPIPELPTDVERHGPQLGGSRRLGPSQAGKVTPCSVLEERTTIWSRG